LTLSLDKLDKNQYDLEITKIEPQTKEFANIAKNAKNIIQKSVQEVIVQAL
jgi:hypothetical protein